MLGFCAATLIIATRAVSAVTFQRQRSWEEPAAAAWCLRMRMEPAAAAFAGAWGASSVEPGRLGGETRRVRRRRCCCHQVPTAGGLGKAPSRGGDDEGESAATSSRGTRGAWDSREHRGRASCSQNCIRGSPFARMNGAGVSISSCRLGWRLLQAQGMRKREENDEEKNRG